MTGIGDGMVPSNSKAQYGIKRFSSEVPSDLTWQYFPDQVQHMSGRINGTFSIYHEFGHGDDDYLVVYQEDGLVSLGNLISDQQLGRGYFIYRMDTSVTPNLTGDGVSWVASSPATVNQSIEKTETTVDTFETSINLGINAEGGTAGESMSESTQIWHGYSMKVSDWNITENSDAQTNKCAWMWYQNVPWTGNDKPIGDFGWWQQAYNVGGGWDDTKALPELSRTSLQYHSSACWRFNKSLITANNMLNVTFSGGATYYLAAISMPQLGNSGHHQILYNTPSNTWQLTIDLVAESLLK